MNSELNSYVHFDKSLCEILTQLVVGAMRLQSQHRNNDIS